jgi:hypothetical protein
MKMMMTETTSVGRTKTAKGFKKTISKFEN